MKKTLCLFIAFVFLLASCSQNYKTNTPIKNDMEINEYSGMPMVVYATLAELKEIKNAFDDMEPDEFYEYIKNEKTEQFISGMRNYERTKDLLEELTETSVPLLDGDENNFTEIGFYWENNIIHQKVSWSENQRISVLIDTVKSSRPKELQLNDNAVFVSVKNIKNENYTANLYKVENADYSFFADVTVDGTYIVLRTLDFYEMEEFEECFTRLKFVKIGDLLDKSNIEVTTENISHTEPSGEEVSDKTEVITTETNMVSDITAEIVTEDYSETEATE